MAVFSQYSSIAIAERPRLKIEISGIRSAQTNTHNYEFVMSRLSVI
jgi:hypothetical protein